MKQYNKTCPCCGDAFISPYPNTKYCNICETIAKLVISKAANNTKWQMMIIGYDPDQKKEITDLLKKIKKSMKKVDMNNRKNSHIIARALNMYADYLEEDD